MKPIHLIRVFALIIIIVSAATLAGFAKKPVITNAPTTAATIHSTLSSYLKFPANVNRSEYEGTVDLIFLIEDGKMIIEKATSDNKDLAAYVKEELGKICCKHIRSLTNQHYAVRLNFALLEQ
jgi:hypothetical protein